MKKLSTYLLAALASYAAIEAQAAGLKLPAIISDHMVLQADQSDPVWGWSDPRAAVKIDFVDAQGARLAHAETKADANGKWAATLPALKVGAAGQINVAAGMETGTVKDVLVGETWLCSGQSNMEYNVNALAGHAKAPAAGEPESDMKATDESGGEQKLAAAKQEATDAHGALRFFMTLRCGNKAPQDDVWGRWEVASPDNVGRCSAVAWNFAVQLHAKLQRPVGLVVSAVGGSAAETWMPLGVLQKLSLWPAMNARVNEDAAKMPGALDLADQQMLAWFKATPVEEIENRAKTRPVGEPLPSAPKDPAHPAVLHVPTRYYNGMISGLIPYGIKGVLWYQADANSSRPEEYPELIKGLISAWRADWRAELPFYYVEMQSLGAYQTQPIEEGTGKPHVSLAILRGMCAAALQLPKTDVATAIDLNNTGADIDNAHYANKKPLGQRLANEALAQVYGQNTGEVHSPALAGFKIEGNKVRVSLSSAAGLRARNGQPLKGFAIKGASGEWMWGDATISGNDILVSNAQISNPTAVRYAWAPNPILTVENGVGLPLRPFRTDKDAPSPKG